MRGSLRVKVDDVPRPPAPERVEILCRSGAVRIERILSMGHVSPPGFWYEQEQSEWVLLEQGAAELELEDGTTLALTAGDWVELRAGVRHRVAWTEPHEATVWLAVFYPAEPPTRTEVE